MENSTVSTEGCRLSEFLFTADPTQSDVMHLTVENVSMLFSTLQYNDEDSYVFVAVLEGDMVFEVDFEPKESRAGYGFILMPRQVFKFVEASDSLSAIAVRIDKKHLGEDMLHELRFRLICHSAFPFSDIERDEVRSLSDIILRRATDTANPHKWMGVEYRLVASFAAMVAEGMGRWARQNHAESALKGLPLLVKLHELLEKHLRVSRQTAYYAGLLGFTPSYLNEKIKIVVGVSVSLYLRSLSTLNICRMLALGDDTIHDIALAYGYDDPAYFSRVFTSLRGISPKQFRARHKGS